MALLQVYFTNLRTFVGNYFVCQYVDYALHDIPSAEEATIV
jgi:hypothetical protein